MTFRKKIHFASLINMSRLYSMLQNVVLDVIVLRWWKRDKKGIFVNTFPPPSPPKILEKLSSKIQEKTCWPVSFVQDATLRNWAMQAWNIRGFLLNTQWVNRFFISLAVTPESSVQLFIAIKMWKQVDSGQPHTVFAPFLTQFLQRQVCNVAWLVLLLLLFVMKNTAKRHAWWKQKVTICRAIYCTQIDTPPPLPHPHPRPRKSPAKGATMLERDEHSSK